MSELDVSDNFPCLIILPVPAKWLR